MVELTMPIISRSADREPGPEKNEFMELVYDREAAPVIYHFFPNAEFSDASSELREGRFQVILSKDDMDKFYTMMILEGWVRCCLCFELQLRTGDSKDRKDLERWLASAKKLKAAGYVPIS